MNGIENISQNMNYYYQYSAGIDTSDSVKEITSAVEENQATEAFFLKEEDKTSASFSSETKESKSAASQNELSEEDKKKIEKLSKRDREVRTHEQAHVAAAGVYARGGAHFECATGPDGRRYAKAGHVNIDTSEESDPDRTISKAQIVQRAALAPSDPSAQDRKVAMQAARMENEARSEKVKEQQEEFAAKMEAGNDVELEPPISEETTQEFKVPEMPTPPGEAQKKDQVSDMEGVSSKDTDEKNQDERVSIDADEKTDSDANLSEIINAQSSINQIKIKIYQDEQLTRAGNLINILS